MEYYGKSNITRLTEVYSENIKEGDVVRYCGSTYSKAEEVVNTETIQKFLKDEGLLGKFLYQRWKAMGERYCNVITEEDFNYREDIPVITYSGEEFYVIERNEKRYYYKEIPRFTNDLNFYWKENERYGVKECVLNREHFQMFCILKTDGEVTVEIRYTKCENKHRNVVTISTINIYDGSNETILKAIDQWAGEFTEDLLLAGFKGIVKTYSNTDCSSIRREREWNKEELLEKKKNYKKKKKFNEDNVEQPKKKRGRPRKIA